ncbi:MAG: mevalonate kinase [Mangrovibacterium sp.]
MKLFYAKLLLFGEYGLMFGASALALPFHRYNGQLVLPGEGMLSPESRKSHLELERFISWFGHEKLNGRMNFPLDSQRLRTDVESGLFFRSGIPQEYGVGSSGALCAALFHEYSRYGDNVTQVARKHSLPEALKHDFALMEAYFHGRSSGLDPLVSFLNQPLLFNGDGKISLPGLSTESFPFSVRLIDTGCTGATSPLVNLFHGKMEDTGFKEAFHRFYLPANDGAVDAFLEGHTDKLFTHLRQITRFQLDYLSEMIPRPFREKMEDMLAHDIPVKLLGSGGGGYLLAFVPGQGDADLLPGAIQAF